MTAIGYKRHKKAAFGAAFPACLEAAGLIVDRLHTLIEGSAVEGIYEATLLKIVYGSETALVA